MTTVALTVPADNDARVLAKDLADIEQIELFFERELLKNSFYEFLKAAWHIIEPEQPYVDNWHVKKLCDLAQDIVLNKTVEKHWIFNIPPGTLKSIIFSVMLNAWVWARDGRKRFFAASYGAGLSMRDNLRVKQIVESEWFRKRFNTALEYDPTAEATELADDQKAKGRFNTNKGGWRFATSVRGMGTGEHPDFILIDDPLSAMQAASKADRDAANMWVDQTLSSRGITRGVIVILIMQRLHMLDTTGHLKKKGGWKMVCFPMRFKTARPASGDDPGYQPSEYDARTTEGELLFPGLFTEEKVKALEVALGQYGAAGQLQQEPSPEGGGLFKREWFKFLDARPNLARRVRGYDTAATEGGGDYTAGVLIAEEFEEALINGKHRVESTGRIIVENVLRGQWGPANVEANMKVQAELDGKKVPIRIEQEGGSSGKSTGAAYIKLLAGWDVSMVHLGSDKEERAKAFRAQAEGGNVYLLRAPWNETYIEELCGFPTAEHDDQVDGSSCAYNTLLLEPKPKRKSAAW
jgi:predicted phage terminase large subunit-like protein